MMGPLLVAFVVLAVASWIASAILARAAVERPYITSLIERTVSALLKSVASTLIAFLVLALYVFHWEIEPETRLTILLTAVALFELPALIWLGLLVGKRFGR